jgi:Flp pilus assembly protein TadD
MKKSCRKFLAPFLTLFLTQWAFGANSAPSPTVTTSTPAASAGLWDPASSSCRPLSAEESTKLGMIRQMIETNKPHAALAYLEAARVSAPQSELLKADALRQTGRATQATQIYLQLRTGCMAGYAQQGLGLLASEAGQTDESLAALKAASAALPVDAEVRNDYGYVLMAAGDNQAAIHEFMTALELDPSNRRTVNNLILVLLRAGDTSKAKEFASRLGVFPATLAELQEIARQPIRTTKQ